jgi:hypothetical protein
VNGSALLSLDAQVAGMFAIRRLRGLVHITGRSKRLWLGRKRFCFRLEGGDGSSAMREDGS